MADEPEHQNDHELMKLLPFYANCTLDEQEQLCVEDFLTRSEEARQELVFLCRLRDAVKKQPGVNSPGELGLKRLQKGIARNTADETAHGSGAGGQASERAGNAQLSAHGHGPVLQVTFKPQATEAAIRSLLLEARLSIKEGPSSLGIYYLDLESGANGATLNTALQKLRTHRDIVDTAEID